MPWQVNIPDKVYKKIEISIHKFNIERSIYKLISILDSTDDLTTSINFGRTQFNHTAFFINGITINVDLDYQNEICTIKSISV